MMTPRDSAVAEIIGREQVSEAVPQGLVPTPFQPRLRDLASASRWIRWAGYASLAVVSKLDSEYFAIRNQATLFDASPLHKYRIRGADAERVLNRMLTRNIGKLRPGRVGYVVWCDEEGMVIDDGTVFRMGADEFRLCSQESQFSWLHDAGDGFEVDIVDESERVAALALQGPTSYAVLESAGLGSCKELAPYDFQTVEPGLLVSRTGYTGDLGYELWVAPEAALDLWDRLWQAGREHGLRAIGSEALNIARLEAGFLAPGVDFHSIHHATRTTRGRTPFELGLGRLVDFNKGHFNGRRALIERQRKGPRYSLVALDVDGAKPAGGALIYHRKRKPVGHVTSAVWSPTVKRNIALAELKAPYGVSRTGRLYAEIYIDKEGKWETLMTPVRIVERPFFKHPRSRATPPGAF